MELCLKHQYISCYLLQFAFMTCKDISKDFQLNNETYHSKWTTNIICLYVFIKKKKKTGEGKQIFAVNPNIKQIPTYFVLKNWCFSLSFLRLLLGSTFISSTFLYVILLFHLLFCWQKLRKTWNWQSMNNFMDLWKKQPKKRIKRIVKLLFLNWSWKHFEKVTNSKCL